MRFTGLPSVVLAFYAKLLKAPLNWARHILLKLRLLHVNFPKIQNKPYVILSRTNYPDAYRIAVVSGNSKWQLLFLFLVNFFTGKTRCKLFRFLQLFSTISLLKRNSSLLQQTFPWLTQKFTILYSLSISRRETLKITHVFALVCLVVYAECLLQVENSWRSADCGGRQT